MNISIKKTKKSNSKLLFVSIQDTKKKSGNNHIPKNLLSSLTKDNIFKGQWLETVSIPASKKGDQHLFLVGLGEEKNLDYEQIRRATAKAYRLIQSHHQETVELVLETLNKKTTSDWERISQSVAEAFVLTSFKVDEFKKKKEKNLALKEVYLDVPSKNQSKTTKGLTKGKILGECTNVAKKVATYPGNFMTPTILANEAVKQTKDTKIKTTVWDKKRIIKEKMGGLLGVSLGSSQEPRFIIMEYKGTSASKKPICFVGKGLTFDAGGISLKPSNAMDEMKFDMCGSTAVLGTLLAIEKLKLKVNVLGIIPSSENLLGASATKPGDILKARNGKTMEILNTDAEGRLILADALSYASELKPQAIFDAATLTGAIVMSLGNLFTGFFTKNTTLVKKVMDASEISGERVWRMPLIKEHTKDMSSAIADISNLSSQRGAGSSTAAAFLEQFVDKNIPWAHFDIAGTSYNVSNRLEYCSPKLASGAMVRTFVEIAKSYE